MAIYWNYDLNDELMSEFKNIVDKYDIRDFTGEDFCQYWHDAIWLWSPEDEVLVGASGSYTQEWIYDRGDNPYEINANLYSTENVLKHLINDYQRYYQGYEQDTLPKELILEIKDCIKNKYQANDFFIVVFNSYGEDDKVNFFSSKEEAETELRELENSEKPYAIDYIKTFEEEVYKKTGFDFIDVELDKCKNDFKVFIYGDMLIIDNAKELEEKEVDEIADFLEFEKAMENEYGIHITDCQKYTHDIGFTRGYEITFKKDGIEIEKDIELSGWTGMRFSQGNKRGLKELIESECDIDELLEEFEEEKKYELEV